MSRELSQQEIDAVFQNKTDRKRETPAVKFDFRRPDRIPKSQVRAIHLLHDTFVRNLVSSLSAYLRSYLTVNLVSVEQLSYAEFLDGLPSPTCIVSLGLRPYDGNGVLELNPSLVFPILEMLLGGTGKSSATFSATSPKSNKSCWTACFASSCTTCGRPGKGLRRWISPSKRWKPSRNCCIFWRPTKPWSSIGVEVRIGESVGMMNIAMPSIVIKMMRQKFDQQWSVRKTHANAAEQARVLRMLREGTLELEARLEGPTVTSGDLLRLEEGHLLTFDYPVERPVELLVNAS